MALLLTGLAVSNSAHSEQYKSAQNADFSILPLPDRKPLAMNIAFQVKQTSDIPLPLEKPNFTRPIASSLLSFGSTPLPKARPVNINNGMLSPHDIKLYRDIFALQDKGEWDKADALYSMLDDLALRGHILYQRFMHPTKYRASFAELKGWMDMYADHPGAKKVHRLAVVRAPKTFKGTIAKPLSSIKKRIYIDPLSQGDNSYITSKRYSYAEAQKIESLQKRISSLLSRGAPTRAYKLLQQQHKTTPLDPVEYDELQALIARSFMIAGKDLQARKLASKSALRSGNKVPIAGWVGGLVAWKKQDYKLSAALFELTATSPYASQWTVTAGAYWASRAHSKIGNTHEVSKWLNVASQNPRTFYGLIAGKALGKRPEFNWSAPEFTDEYAGILRSNKAGVRAMALATIGQYHLAEAELKQIDSGNNQKLEEALIAYASQENLPAFSMRLAEATQHPQGGIFDAAYYPVSPWRPQGGYKVDRALINALIRQESRFNPYAQNTRSGATGLMQLMPSTARYVGRNANYHRELDRFALKNPQTNLDIGQHYIEDLMSQSAINEELFSLVIAYNAGPGNLRRWKREFSDIADDPLLFVESIPMSETRAFVERVMSNYWIYRMRFNQPTPSLDRVARNQWPQYVQLDNVRVAHSPGSAPYVVADTKRADPFAKISSR